jgi:hypothetical protein
MNCFESRRLLLAAPRQRTDMQEQHLASCEACARLVGELAGLDRGIIKATRLPVPEGLAERILLARRRSGRPWYAVTAAAALLVVTIATMVLVVTVRERDEPMLAGDAVGPLHPAVAAISIVLEQEPQLLKHARTLDPAVLQERLKSHGLALKEQGISVLHVGWCQLAGRECEHLVLATPEGHVSLFLMADERPSARVIVADRRMTALLSPAPSGAYIVIAESPRAVKRARKLLVHG